MRSKTKNIALTGLMTAVIAVISVWQIPLPFGVPLTFQTFATALAGYTIGKMRGTLAAFTYIVLGAAGLPFFTGFQGGISVIMGPTGGFILGFLPLAFLSGLGSTKKPLPALILGLSGLLICHLAGDLHFSFVTDTSPAASFLAVSLPYLSKDALLTAAAYFISRPIRKNILNN